MAELTVASALHKATAHRLLAALVVENMVDLTPQGYVLGANCWALGRAAQARFDVAELAAPSLKRIADETGDVGLLSVRTGFHVRCIGRTEGSHPILPTSIQVGAVRPLGCGAHSLAHLAALDDDTVMRAVDVTAEERAERFPGVGRSDIIAKVAETRSQGFALAEGDIVAGMSAVAIVVFNPWGQPLAALSCAAIASRLPPDRRPDLVGLLRQEARAIETRFSQTLGH